MQDNSYTLSKTGVSEADVPSVTFYLTAGYRIYNYEDLNKWSPVDLGFANDLSLLSHIHNQIQEKTVLLSTESTQTGLNINRSKTNTTKTNTKTKNQTHSHPRAVKSDRWEAQKKT